jgi:hypothetical protein
MTSVAPATSNKEKLDTARLFSDLSALPTLSGQDKSPAPSKPIDKAFAKPSVDTFETNSPMGQYNRMLELENMKMQLHQQREIIQGIGTLKQSAHQSAMGIVANLR